MNGHILPIDGLTMDGHEHNPKTFAANLRWLCDFSTLSRFEIAEMVANRLCRGERSEVKIKTIEDKLARWLTKGLRQIDGKSKKQIDTLLDVLGMPHLIDDYEDLWNSTPEWVTLLRYEMETYAAASYVRSQRHDLWQKLGNDKANKLVREYVAISPLPQSVLRYFEQQTKELDFDPEDDHDWLAERKAEKAAAEKVALENNQVEGCINRLKELEIWKPYQRYCARNGRDPKELIDLHLDDDTVEDVVAMISEVLVKENLLG